MASHAYGYINPPFTGVFSVRGHERRNHLCPPLGDDWYMDP